MGNNKQKPKGKFYASIKIREEHGDYIHKIEWESLDKALKDLNELLLKLE